LNFGASSGPRIWQAASQSQFSRAETSKVFPPFEFCGFGLTSGTADFHFFIGRTADVSASDTCSSFEVSTTGVQQGQKARVIATDAGFNQSLSAPVHREEWRAHHASSIVQSKPLGASIVIERAAAIGPLRRLNTRYKPGSSRTSVIRPVLHCSNKSTTKCSSRHPLR